MFKKHLKCELKNIIPSISVYTAFKFSNTGLQQSASAMRLGYDRLAAFL